MHIVGNIVWRVTGLHLRHLYLAEAAAGGSVWLPSGPWTGSSPAVVVNVGTRILIHEASLHVCTVSLTPWDGLQHVSMLASACRRGRARPRRGFRRCTTQKQLMDDALVGSNIEQ